MMKKKLLFLLAAAGGFFAVKKYRSGKNEPDLWTEATSAPDLR